MASTRSSLPKISRPSSREGGLGRERILQAAIGLIDKGGLQALNMRDLGRTLGTSTMAVYRHFQNKSDLLNEVIDLVVGQFDPLGLQGNWQDKVRAICLKVRKGMLAHPELADVIGRELRRSSTSFRVNARIIEALHDAGVPAELLAQTYWAISSYTTGYALLEAQAKRRHREALATSSQADRVQKLASMMRSVDGISERGLQLAPLVISQQLDDAQFMFGLECLISGLEARIAPESVCSSQSDA